VPFCCGARTQQESRGGPLLGALVRYIGRLFGNHSGNQGDFSLVEANWFGGGGGIRTCDQGLMSPLLCH